MKHLLVNKHCDCKHNIGWIAKNIKTCRINREYKDRHEPTFWGVSISVQFVEDEEDTWLEFAANDEGWMYVSDWYAKGLPEISVNEGIAEVEANVGKVLAEMMMESHRIVEELEGDIGVNPI